MAARRRTFPAEYGTAPFAQASPMAAPLPIGLDTGSATQRTAAMPDELDAQPDDEDPAMAALLRLLKMGDMGGGE